MTNFRSIFIPAAAALLISLVYRNIIHDLLFKIIGVNRFVQPLSDFPYNCRRLHHEHLEACEDLWLDEKGRQLYLACAGSISRSNWNPGGNRCNPTGRRPSGGVISLLDIDIPGEDGMYGLRQLEVVGYQGSRNDGTFDPVGIDVEVMPDAALRLWLVNAQPPVSDGVQVLDATNIGGNATIELFEIDRDRRQMVHVKTFFHEAIETPNKPAAVGDGAFLVTNDHSAKVGLRRELDVFLGGGSVAYCNFTSCHIAAKRGLAFPNGMVKGSDGLYYVPNILRDKISVMKLGPDLMLTETAVIRLGMPVDNLSVDRNGDLWAAAFPKALEMTASVEDPHGIFPRSALWRIQKQPDGYVVKKMVEDRDTVALAGGTTVVHDTQTGRLFVGGAVAPFITICEPI